VPQPEFNHTVPHTVTSGISGEKLFSKQISLYVRYNGKSQNVRKILFGAFLKPINESLDSTFFTRNSHKNKDKIFFSVVHLFALFSFLTIAM